VGRLEMYLVNRSLLLSSSHLVNSSLIVKDWTIYLIRLNWFALNEIRSDEEISDFLEMTGEISA
jgi:hypothetical protein